MCREQINIYLCLFYCSRTMLHTLRMLIGANINDLYPTYTPYGTRRLTTTATKLFHCLRNEKFVLKIHFYLRMQMNLLLN